MFALKLLEKNLLPDFLIRHGIRKLNAERLKEESKGSLEERSARLMQWIETLKKSPIAIETEAANAQHYQLPTEFFKLCLGKHLKYSACYWDDQTSSLDDAEEQMLKLYCKRAKILNGQKILELGAGWGSLALYLAEKYPESEIITVSNSKTQKIYIDQEIEKRHLKNLTVQTADINTFDTSEKFDRIVSIEMLEHLRNYQKLFQKISGWMKNDALLFVHIFTHLRYAYPFEIKNDQDWIAKYFFTGGMIPSDSLLLYFQENLEIVHHWQLDGTHYQKTAEAWLEKLDQSKDKAMPILEKNYGKKEALKWFVYWRFFFLACSELWGFHQGEEWIVSHYLFKKRI